MRDVPIGGVLIELLDSHELVVRWNVLRDPQEGSLSHYNDRAVRRSIRIIRYTGRLFIEVDGESQRVDV